MPYGFPFMWADQLNVIWQAGKQIRDSFEMAACYRKQLRWPLDPKAFSNGKQTRDLPVTDLTEDVKSDINIPQLHKQQVSINKPKGSLLF